MQIKCGDAERFRNSLWSNASLINSLVSCDLPAFGCKSLGTERWAKQQDLNWRSKHDEDSLWHCDISSWEGIGDLVARQRFAHTTFGQAVEDWAIQLGSTGIISRAAHFKSSSVAVVMGKEIDLEFSSGCNSPVSRSANDWGAMVAISHPQGQRLLQDQHLIQDLAETIASSFRADREKVLEGTAVANVFIPEDEVHDQLSSHAISPRESIGEALARVSDAVGARLRLSGLVMFDAQ